MLKKLIVAVCLIVLLLISGVVQAQEEYLPKPGTLPDSPFYFLKEWGESAGTIFTFDDEAKARRHIDLSERRLAEAQAVIEKGKLEAVKGILDRYQEHLSQAWSTAEDLDRKGKDTGVLLSKLTESTFRHQEYLTGIYRGIPESLKSDVEKVVLKNKQINQQSMKALSPDKRQEVAQRIEQYKEKQMAAELARQPNADKDPFIGQTPPT